MTRPQNAATEALPPEVLAEIRSKMAHWDGLDAETRLHRQRKSDPFYEPKDGEAGYVIRKARKSG